jgi:hypothetical protein
LIDRGEFSESDNSDNEYEEEEIDSEEDYIEGDDHSLRNEVLEECKKANYENGWTRNPSDKIDEFPFTPENDPKPNFNKEEEAFTSLISPGIINM